MKKVKVWMGLLLCFMLLCGVLTAQASDLKITDGADVLEEAKQFPFFAETDELAVNIRKDINTKSAKVGRIERGTQLVVTGAQINDVGEIWYAVELKDGTIGYIRSDLLKRVEEEILLQASEAEHKAPAAAFSSFRAKTTQAAVNVRANASAKGGKVGQVSRGQILTVVSQVINSAGETWYAVKLSDGTEGFIRSDLLMETDEEESVQTSYQSANKETKTQKSTEKSGSGEYIGNKKTKKFHRSSCRSLPKESNRVRFSSRDKAKSSGYSPCKICNP